MISPPFHSVVTGRTELIANCNRQQTFNHYFKVRAQDLVLYATSCLRAACKFAGNSLLTTIVGNELPESFLVYSGLTMLISIDQVQIVE